jgi:hypothetical protein
VKYDITYANETEEFAEADRKAVSEQLHNLGRSFRIPRPVFSGGTQKHAFSLLSIFTFHGTGSIALLLAELHLIHDQFLVNYGL